jgi:hypothetical protein
VPWSIRDRESVSPPPADQFALYTYSTAMWHSDARDPRSPRLSLTELLDRIPIRARQITEVLGSRLKNRVQGVDAPEYELDPLHAGITSILVSCLLVLTWRHRSAAEFFSLGSLGVMCIYFGFADRLLLPVYALLFCGAVEVVRDLAGRWIGVARSQFLVSALLLGLMGIDFELHADWDRIERSYDEIVQIGNELAPLLTAETRLATLKGHHYMALFDRPIVSLRFVLNREKGKSAIEDVIDKYDVNTVFLPNDIANQSLAEYFDGRYGSGENVGSITLWRVRD